MDNILFLMSSFKLPELLDQVKLHYVTEEILI